MGPALLVQCDNAIELSKRLIREWLTRYMFRGVDDGAERASRVADYLGSHAHFKSHARRVKLEHLNRSDFGLHLRNFREETDLYPRVWEVYCTMDITFANTSVYKLFYNSLDDAMIRQAPQAGIELVVGQPTAPPQAPAVPQL